MDGTTISFARPAAAAMIGVLLSAGVLLAAQDQELNRVADGGFESGFVSLTLPVVDYFPWVVGGWAARGLPAPRVVTDAAGAYEGERALRLTTDGRRPVHLVQDLALVTNGYVLEAAFFPETGIQQIRLFSGWSRELPDKGQLALAVSLAPDGLEVITSVGRWSLEQPIRTNRWHFLRVVGDPRSDLQTISLDGTTVLSLPGVSQSVPVTLVIGDSGDDISSDYLYDAVKVAQLAEIELARLRDQAEQQLDPAVAGRVLNRLETTAAAISAGIPRLAMPELRAARRLIARQANRRASAGEAAFRRALQELLLLLGENASNLQ